MKSEIKKLFYMLQKPLIKSNVIGSGEQFKAVLETTYPKKKIDFHAENTITDPEFDLQIIVPVYNVEKYINKCVDSLLAQKTKYRYHVYLIDDGSTDKSGKIIDSYSKHSDIFTVIHKNNGGVASTRNLGLKKICANYIMFLDSDDFIPSYNSIERLLDVAYRHNADIVAGNFYRFLEREGSISKQIDPNLSQYYDERILQPVKELQGFPWGKIFKAELFSKVCYPEGYWYEDTIISWIIYPSSTKCIYTDIMCNAYRNNPSGQSASGLFSPRAIESTYITEEIIKSISSSTKRRQDIYELFLNQSFINIQRVRNASEEVMRAVFSIMCDLKRDHFRTMKLDTRTFRNKELEKVLISRDYSKMKLILKWL